MTDYVCAVCDQPIHDEEPHTTPEGEDCHPSCCPECAPILADLAPQLRPIRRAIRAAACPWAYA